MLASTFFSARPSAGRLSLLALLACLFAAALVSASPARAQEDGVAGEDEGIPALPPFPGEAEADGYLIQEADAPGEQVVSLTLVDAVQVALRQNYGLQRTRLNIENAQAQIRGAWGQVLPSVNLNSSYTRNVIQADPFAGSNVAGLFGSGNSGDWVAFNERARTDADPTTEPITFAAFQQRQAQGREDAGIDPTGVGSNPFTVDNQFQNSLSISQPLFNGQAFVAISGARQLEEINELAAGREEQTLVNQVRQTYYQALLAAEQARVAAQGVERTRDTYREVARRVAAGTTPRYERISTRVELENLRSTLVQRANDAETAIDQLKRTIGFPVDQPVRLRGNLRAEELGEFRQVSMESAMERAVASRPDVRQAQLAVELNEIDKRQVQAQYLPTLDAFADFSYAGRVPDDRTGVVMPDPTDPFTFGQTSRGFFADNLWNPSVAVGLRLSWNIFGGFQRAATVEQREVAINQARLDYQQLLAQVRLDVQQALRNLATARERLASQRANIERAELNYEIADRRLGVGVSTQLQLREASDQLDQARLNYLQTVYDYLTAQSAFETAVGEPLTEDSVLRFAIQQ